MFLLQLVYQYIAVFVKGQSMSFVVTLPISIILQNGGLKKMCIKGGQELFIKFVITVLTFVVHFLYVRYLHCYVVSTIK